MPQNPPASRYQAIASSTAAAVSFGAMPKRINRTPNAASSTPEHGKTRPGGFYKTFGIQQKIAQPGQGEQDHESFHWQLRKCVVSVYFTAKRGARQHRNYKKIALDTARTAWYNKLLYVAMDSRIQPLLLSLVYQPLCEKSTRMAMF